VPSSGWQVPPVGQSPSTVQAPPMLAPGVKQDPDPSSPPVGSHSWPASQSVASVQPPMQTLVPIRPAQP
jgi:hypothetical protein